MVHLFYLTTTMKTSSCDSVTQTENMHNTLQISFSSFLTYHVMKFLKLTEENRSMFHEDIVAFLILVNSLCTFLILNHPNIENNSIQ